LSRILRTGGPCLNPWLPCLAYSDSQSFDSPVVRLAVIYGSTIETLQQSTGNLLFTAAASFGGGKFPNDGCKVPISTRRRPYEFANLRPTSKRAPSGPIASSCNSPSATAKLCPGPWITGAPFCVTIKEPERTSPRIAKKMPVTALARSGRERLRFDFGVTVSL
jgi:hypothetical protein